MGAWGADSFENDDALDWLADFCDDPEEGFVLAALKSCAEADAGAYLESPECCAAVAAAELVAALKGSGDADLPEDVSACLADSNIKPEPYLVETALKALARIKSGSELKELWDDSEQAGEWQEAMSDLESRLKQ